MSTSEKFDFQYAVENTEIIVEPKGTLETFGNTILNYYLVTEDLDSIKKTKLRIGRMQLLRPQIITPSQYSQIFLEGFSEEAQQYVKSIMEKDECRILRYGYTLKQEAFSEETITDSAANVIDHVKTDIRAKKDPYIALIKGVEKPWDVSLVRLFMAMVQKSVQKNVMDMTKQHMFDKSEQVMTLSIKQEIENAFRAAERDPSLIQSLGVLLQKNKVFPLYEERFFKLMNKAKKR
ncbi:MAG: hypothetical protein J6V41_03260 [Kiritimatiellae bacterium]|nr:hypothetical protein [Kiritimatiellia bacterium]